MTEERAASPTQSWFDLSFVHGNTQASNDEEGDLDANFSNLAIKSETGPNRNYCIVLLFQFFYDLKQNYKIWLAALEQQW